MAKKTDNAERFRTYSRPTVRMATSGNSSEKKRCDEGTIYKKNNNRRDSPRVSERRTRGLKIGSIQDYGTGEGVSKRGAMYVRGGPKSKCGGK